MRDADPISLARQILLNDLADFLLVVHHQYVFRRFHGQHKFGLSSPSMQHRFLGSKNRRGSRAAFARTSLHAVTIYYIIRDPLTSSDYTPPLQSWPSRRSPLKSNQRCERRARREQEHGGHLSEDRRRNPAPAALCTGSHARHQRG